MALYLIERYIYRPPPPPPRASFRRPSTIAPHPTSSAELPPPENSYICVYVYVYVYIGELGGRPLSPPHLLPSPPSVLLLPPQHLCHCLPHPSEAHI